MGSSHTKAFLLLQAHFEHAPLPMADYVNDTKSVLDQAPRVINAMVDIASDGGFLQAALASMQLSQMVVQGCSDRSSSLAQIPSLDDDGIRALAGKDVTSLR